MDKSKVLIQLDTDAQPSAFDRVVAVDAGAEHVFSYGGVKPEQVRDLVHGAIFTRGPKDLKRTAVFIGGSDVAAGEALLAEATRHMVPQFGLRVSILFDANGCNTTAVAAVRAAAAHIDLSAARALILGGTGPVGQRIARLLARARAEVRVASRKRERAAAVVEAIDRRVPQGRLEPRGVESASDLNRALDGCNLVFAAGAAGVQLLPRPARLSASSVRVVVDLNAVPPLGIEGVEVTDRGQDRDGAIAYGAIGVGAAKMKIHKAALARLFESNDQILDIEEIYELASGAV